MTREPPRTKPHRRTVPCILALGALLLGAPLRISAQDNESPDIAGETAVFTGLAGAPEANLFVGAATTSIPIDLPPGRKALTPQLALQYRSGGGPSAFGHGWSLPLGSIRRAPRHGVPSCRDGGQRNDFLVEIPGASIECRLEESATHGRARCRPRIHEGPQRIYLSPAENRWDVWDGNGLRYVFGADREGRTGSTRDHPWLDGESCRSTNEWFLQEIVDANGNHIEIAYEHEEGVAYPVHLRYGGNRAATVDHAYEVAFLWKPRSELDRPSRADGGHLARLTRLLDRIEVRHPVGGVAVRSYESTYEVDLEDEVRLGRGGFLRAVTLYGRNGTALERHDGLPAATVFAYRSIPVEQQGFYRRHAHAPLTDAPPTLHETRHDGSSVQVVVALRDMNGDGFSDLIDARNCHRTENPFWDVFLGSTDGFAAEPVPWRVAQGPIHRCAITHSHFDGADSNTLAETIDIDGDGVPDWIAAHSRHWNVYRGWRDASGAGGFAEPERWTAHVYGVDSGTSFHNLASVRFVDNRRDEVDLVDWNADGLPDIVNAAEGRVRYNTGSGFEAEGIGVDFPDRRLRRTNDNRLVEGLFDLNGDGLPDHVRDVGRGSWEVRLHDGRGLADEVAVWSVPETCAAGIRDRRNGRETRRDLVDLTGDGLPDFVDTCDWTPEHRYWTVHINQGTRFLSTPALWQAPQPFVRRDSRGSVARTSADLADVDGDGHLDFVEVDPDGAMRIHHAAAGYWLVGCDGSCPLERSEMAPVDALIAIENGIGARTTLAYRPSTIWDNRDSDGVPRLPSLLWTLTRIETSSGLPGTGGATPRSIELRYAYGAFDPTTREFRGFGTVESLSTAGARETTIFGQGPLDKGRVLSTTLHAPPAASSALPLRATVNDWQCYVSDDGEVVACADAEPGGTGIRLAASHVYDYGSDGSRKHAWREQRAWDAYGNVLHVRAGGDDSLRVDTLSEFAHVDDLEAGGSSYHIAKPTRVEVVAGRRVEEKWLFYDDLPLGQIAAGNLTRIEAWLDVSVVAAPACSADPRRKCATTQMRYDDVGNPVAVVDALGRTTTTDYGPARIHPVAVTTPLGHVVRSTTDLACGKPLWTSLPDSNVRSSREYDDFCRLRAAMLPGQNAATAQRRWDYYLGTSGVPTDIVVRDAEPSSPTGWVARHELYDGLGRRLQRQRDAVVDGARVVLATDTAIYDGAGRVVSTYPHTVIDQTLIGGAATYRTDNIPPPTRLWYDPLGRVVRTMQPGGTETNANYSTPWQTVTTGQCFHAPDCEGARTVERFDAHGNVVEKHVYDERGAALAMTRYEYDAFGRQTSSQQGDGQRWLGSTRIRTTYDSLGRKVEIDDPDSGRWRFGYDLAGNLVHQDDPEPRRHIELCYDELNRLTQKHVVEGSDRYVGDALCRNPDVASERYVYDDPAIPFGIGRLARVEDASGVTRIHAYDARGNALVVEKGILADGFLEVATTSYTYDRAGHLARVVYPDGERLHYEYDAAGNLRSAFSGNDGTVLLADLTYDRFGRPRQITHGNGPNGIGVVDTRDYHDGDRLFHLERLTTTATRTTKDACSRGRTLLDLRIAGYQANGRITRVVRDSRCADLADDARYRYDGLGRLLEVTGANPERFAYDTLGNLVAKGDRTLTYAATRPHTPTAFAGEALEHDRNGNRIARGSTTYEFDVHDRLVSVDHGALRVAYDHAGTRVRQTAGNVTHRYFNELAEFRIEGGHPILTKHYFAGDLRIASREVVWRPEARDPATDLVALGSEISRRGLQAFVSAAMTLSLLALALFPERRRRGRPRQSTTIATLAVFLLATLPGPLLASGGPGIRTVPLPTVIADPVELRFHHYHVDHLGTPLLLTDGDGDVVAHLRYSAYGEPRGQWDARGDARGIYTTGASRFGFVGYANEAETGLQYAGARWYDPELGSFLSHDPARQFPNPYLYGGGDPINGVDRAGAIFGIDDLLIAVIIGAIAGAVGSGVQAAINGGSVGQALKAGAIGGAIGGASAYVGAGFVGPILGNTVVPAVAGQLVQAGVAATTASTVANVAVYGTTVGAGLSQVGYQASRGNWGPLIGLGVAIGLTAVLAPPTPTAPESGIRTVAFTESEGLPNLSVADLRTGDVLITEDGSMASVTGHTAVVLDAEGDLVRVLSSDNRGRYVETNLDAAVGGRQWDVYRISGIQPDRVIDFTSGLAENGGLLQYLGNRGGNVCSSTCAQAIEFAGGPVAPRAIFNLVTPAALRETYGPPIGRVYIPQPRSI